MMTSKTQKIEMYKVKLSNITGVFSLATTLRKVYKGNFAYYPKPGVHVTTKYKHLKGVEIHDTNIKTNLPTDLTLQSSEYTKIETNLPPRVGSQKNQWKNSYQLARP